MMPPTRIEQLNNFQDAVQSPDGLDRLRALQAVEQALPSSQGLMGMPQVQAPIPMVPRQYGGEVGTGGLLEVLDDGTQVFDSSQEGILNRSLAQLHKLFSFSGSSFDLLPLSKALEY